eukprot:2593979-Prymnesium_polylepis.1
MNCLRQAQIPLRMQLLLWFSGLRGAIAFALAVYFPTSAGSSSSSSSEHGSGDAVEAAAVVKSATMIIVLATTLVLGGLTGPLVKCLGLEQPPSQLGRSRTASQLASPTASEQPLIDRDAPGGRAAPPRPP